MFPKTHSTARQRPKGRSVRTVRSTLSQTSVTSCSYPSPAPQLDDFSGILTDSFVDSKLCELAVVKNRGSSEMPAELLDVSGDSSDYDYDSDISEELEQLASVPMPRPPVSRSVASSVDMEELDLESLSLDFSSSSSEILENEPLDSVEPVVIACVEGLGLSSASVDAKRAAAGTLRALAKNRSDVRALIGAFGAIPMLVPLLRSVDPVVQENSVTALLNLSLEEDNKERIVDAGAIKPLVYVLRTGTVTAKQNAACALLSLSMMDELKATIGASGAIPPLVTLLVSGTSRGKKDAITTLYKLCSIRRNKERAVSAGVVGQLVEMVGERNGGMAEKALVVLESLAVIPEGKEAIAKCGGIQASVEAIEAGNDRKKEFTLNLLLQLCTESGNYRGLLVHKGAIMPLVALSQSGSARVKQKAETLVGYLREQW